MTEDNDSEWTVWESSTYNVLSIDLDWCQSHFHLKQLNRLFYSKIDKAKKIVFGRHHHQIMFDLMNRENIVLHNIDHHHDVQYEDFQIPDIVDNGISTHGCWVGNLIHLGKIKEYYWYKNLNSECKFSDFVTSLVCNQHRLPFHIKEDLSDLAKIETYDLIFVCHSPDYIPPAFHSLYESYLDCCAILYGSKSKMTELLTDLPNAPIFLSDLLEFTPKYIPTTGTANV